MGQVAQKALIEDDGKVLISLDTTLANPTQPFTLATDEIKEVRWINKDELNTVPMWDAYKRTLEVFFKISDK